INHICSDCRNTTASTTTSFCVVVGVAKRPHNHTTQLILRWYSKPQRKRQLSAVFTIRAIYPPSTCHQRRSPKYERCVSYSGQGPMPQIQLAAYILSTAQARMAAVAPLDSRCCTEFVVF
ncbi:hypothetical protein F441_11748, partial [Phytophthora nicotianae CJ01A1]